VGRLVREVVLGSDTTEPFTQPNQDINLEFGLCLAGSPKRTERYPKAIYMLLPAVLTSCRFRFGERYGTRLMLLTTPQK
jgi:hypothetical protein